jgi:hypothetical protein
MEDKKPILCLLELQNKALQELTESKNISQEYSSESECMIVSVDILKKCQVVMVLTKTFQTHELSNISYFFHTYGTYYTRT